MKVDRHCADCANADGCKISSALFRFRDTFEAVLAKLDGQSLLVDDTPGGVHDMATALANCCKLYEEKDDE